MHTRLFPIFLNTSNGLSGLTFNAVLTLHSLSLLHHQQYPHNIAPLWTPWLSHSTHTSPLSTILYLKLTTIAATGIPASSSSKLCSTVSVLGQTLQPPKEVQPLSHL